MTPAALSLPFGCERANRDVAGDSLGWLGTIRQTFQSKCPENLLAAFRLRQLARHSHCADTLESGTLVTPVRRNW